jgi:hypothetical protein
VWPPASRAALQAGEARISDDPCEAYAVGCGSLQHRTRRETFVGLDPHDAMPMPIDYYPGLFTRLENLRRASRRSAS